MGAETAIAWTDHTFNPWWGCTNVSPGCDHCYAETFAKRTGHDVWGKGGDRRFFGDAHWKEPLKWNRQAEAEGVRRRVFCASMADVFEARDDLQPWRNRLWALIDATSYLDWQLLTKRPENVCGPARWMVPPEWIEEPQDWPANVWLGTTVEDQQRARLRIPRLLRVPARVRFLSCEPLLGDVNLCLGSERGHGLTASYVHAGGCCDHVSGIAWVICGGESGPKHRPMDLDHARLLRDQCEASGIPFFFKQVGGRTPKAGGDLLDGREHKQFPTTSEAA